MAQREPLARRSLRARLIRQGRPPTFLEVAVMAVGVRRGAEVLWALVMWTVARRKKGGGAPVYQDFMATALLSKPAAMRQLAMLREVWGGEEGIAAMADIVEESCGAAIGELVAVSEGGKDRATAMLLAASLPAVGFTV